LTLLKTNRKYPYGFKTKINIYYIYRAGSRGFETFSIIIYKITICFEMF